jgi:iron complex outermembrane receptor protein
MLKRIIFLLILSTLFVARAGAQESLPDSTAAFQGESVLVTASRYDDTVHLSQTNITAEDLKYREPDLPLPMLLQDTPGLFAYSDAGSGLGYTYLRIRGFDQRRVGVLVNGIPFNDPEDHQLWWVDMPDLAASLQDVQVQRGVTNSIGGLSSIGGTVNLVTDPLGPAPRGRASLGAGSYGFNRQMLKYETGALPGGVRSSLRVTHQASDGYRQRSAVDQWAVFWSGLYQTERSVTQINFYTGREQTHHAWDSSPESELERDRTHNPETYHNAIDDFKQPHTELHNTFFLSQDVTLRNSLYYVQGEGFYENFKDDETAEDYSLDRLLGLDAQDEVDLVRRKWVRKDQVGWVPQLQWRQSRGRLIVGGDWYTFHSNHWGDVLMVEGFTPDDLLRQSMKYHSYTGDKDAVSVYANQHWELAPGLTLMGDLQFQHKSYTFMQNEVGNFRGDLRNAYTVDYDFFNPKGGVHWQAGRAGGGDLAFYGSVGVNRREPADNDLFDTWQGGDDLGVQPLFGRSEIRYKDDGTTVDHVEWFDPQVHEEKVVDYEAGLSWAGQNLSFTLGGYWMDFRDEIVPYGGVDEDGLGIRGNAGKTLHRGIELGLRALVAPGNLLTVAASRSWDEFDEFIFTDYDGATADYSGNPIALFPEHLLTFALRSDLTPSVTTQLRLRRVGKQYLDNTGSEDRVIDPWNTVDISLWCDLGGVGLKALSGARGFIHVRNVADERYETTGYYNPWGGVDYSGENHYTPGPGRNFALGVDYDF